MTDELMALFSEKGIRDVHLYDDPDKVVDRIGQIYDQGVAIMQEAFDRFTAGDDSVADHPIDACYPFLGVKIDSTTLNLDARLSYGVLHDPGVYGTTLTRPELFSRLLQAASGTLDKASWRQGRCGNQQPAYAIAVRY